MTMTPSARLTTLATAAAFALFGALPAAIAQTAPAKAAATKPAKKKSAPAKPAELAPPEAANAEQIEAAGRVYYGVYACEFNQAINIAASPKYPSYVDVKHGKADYVMKPVLSSTGAIRLEDVRGETLMVQISSKSMLLNVKTGQRLVDDCISPKQRELIEEARLAKLAAAAAAAASAAAPAPAPAASASPDAATSAAATSSTPAQVK